VTELLCIDHPVYVQRQLGYSSIRLTVDLYGGWLPMENKAASIGWTRPRPAKVVARR
jgi:hypothetical protein